MTRCQLLTASFQLLACQTILREMNGSPRAEKPLITACALCHSLSPSSASFLLSSAHLSLSPLLSLSPPCSSLHPFPVMHTLPVLPLPPLERWSVFQFFFFIIPSSQHTHTFKIPLSLWLSSSAILADSSRFALSVSAENIINQRLAGFLTCDYLWSGCSDHFHAADKCAEYSTQARQGYSITD